MSLAFTILKTGLPSGHDIGAHTAYSRLFTDALRQGQFPVRWVEWIQNGFSLPLFNFYQVGFYYLVSTIHTLIPSLTQSIKITVLLLWWTGALLMFLYAKRFGLLSGAVAAVVYAFTPYLILDIFVRAAYPEISAITFSVGVLWALDRLLTSAKPIYGLPLALFFGLTIISHLPTLVIMLPLLLGYILLLLLSREGESKTIPLIGISLALGLGIAAFYLLPAFFELNLVKSALLTSDYYNFRSHFVYPEQIFTQFWGYGISTAGAEDGMSFQFGIIQWLIIGISLAAAVIWKLPHLFFWLLAIFYALFFMHDTSLSFWENIYPLSIIQYPWRFLMVVPFATAALSAILVGFIKQRWAQFLCVSGLILGVAVFYHPYLTPAIFLPNDYFNIDSESWRESPGVAQNVILEKGYLPTGVKELPSQNIPRWIVAEGKGEVEERVIRDDYLSFNTNSQGPLILSVNSHYFPGWKAFIDNIETGTDTQNSLGFLNISIPQGPHKVEVKFTDTMIRSFANTITILSLIALLAWQITYISALLSKSKRGLN